MPSLADIKHLIIDMDGVLYHGDRAMPMLCEFFAFLRERPIPFILATNNSTRTPQEYADKLARMGVQVSPAEILRFRPGRGAFPGARVSTRDARPRFWHAIAQTGHDRRRLRPGR